MPSVVDEFVDRLSNQPSQYDVVVIGSLVADISSTHAPFSSSGPSAPKHGSSNPAVITQCVGGVAHNIALAAHYLGANVLLCSVVADDAAGRTIQEELAKAGLSCSGIIQLPTSLDVRTGQYVGNYDDKKNLLFGMADVTIMQHSSLQDERLWSTLIHATKPLRVVLDTCFSHLIMSYIFENASHVGASVLLEPVSVPRAEDLMARGSQMLWAAGGHITLTPNEAELSAMYQAAIEHTHVRPLQKQFRELLKQQLEAPLAALAEQAVSLVSYFRIILTTCGKDGCLLVQKLSDKDVVNFNDEAKQYVFVLGDQLHPVYIRHFPPPTILAGDEIISVNGAGDSLVGAIVATGLEEIKTPSNTPNRVLGEELIRRVQEAAAITMKSSQAVSPDIKSLRQ